MTRMTSLAAFALCASTAFASADAFAQATDDWQFAGSLNLFLPSVSSTTVFPPPLGGNSASVDSGKILESLNFTFMGSLQAQRGAWGLFTDVVYLDMSADKSGSRALTIGRVELPADVSANVDFGLRGWSWTLGGSYRVVSTPDYSFDLVGGARLLDLEATVDWTLAGNVGSIALADRSGSGKARVRPWDAIVGFKGRYAFGEGGKWFTPYYFDVGTGGSQLTVQAIAGLGYSYRWGDILGTWRYLGYNMKSDRGIQDLSFNGPMVSAVFHW